ncbi:MAG: superoxide dismutase family protein [Ruminococcaceae bacterium]|nr:superoxide dismutase family protein [Oscillospiraceae bacterium]
MNCNFCKPQAIALIGGGNSTPTVSGIIKFYQKQSCVLIVADIKGLPNTDTGFFGFHIHEGGDCGGIDFSNTKSHYNPDGTPHPKHAGDLPPLMLCGDTAHSSVLTDRFKVSDIIGRTVVIHDMADDFTSQPSGNSGEKIACGIIKKL